MVQLVKYSWTGVLGLAWLIAFITMIISAILVRSYNSDGAPSTHLKTTVGYSLFVSLWQLIIGGAWIGITLFLSSSIIASVGGTFVFVLVTWVFWLASAASLETAQGGVFSCNNPAFAHCHQLLALEAFSWINFIIFSFALIIIGVIAYRQKSVTAPLSMSEA